MTISEMLSQSGILTVMGMGVVFSFLIIMILAMMILHSIVHAFKWDSVSEDAAAAAAPVPSAPASDSGAVVAAIAAAIEESRG